METSKVEWSKINWRKAEFEVDKLQKRIYLASVNGSVRKVRNLQKTLSRSFLARCLAVRKVSQDNQGKKTAGVDGIKSLSPKMLLSMLCALKFSDKAKPTRRVMIPKPGTTEKRPLGIPVMQDRATQALAKIILEPEWSARFEGNSYGFRPGRSAQDAIGAIFNSIRGKAKWVLDADIAKCFDKIDQKALLKKVQTYPTIKRQLKAWLKSGVVTSGTFEPTDSGTQKGGVISPLLANIALHGLEKHLNKVMNREGQLIRYADDFVYLHEDREKVEIAKKHIAKFLSELGLELKISKTRITHTSKGFDFLGFNIRQYKTGAYRAARNGQGQNLGFKTLIKPSKDAIKKHLRNLAEIIDQHKHAPQAALITNLNPVIRGWCNYYSKAVSKEVFSYCDYMLYEKLLAWAKRRHSGKCQGVREIVSKYWHTKGNRNWVFTHNKITLLNHADTRIVRHTKIQGDKSPFDGDTVYWSLRLKRCPSMPLKKVKLLEKQKGKCTHCKTTFKAGDLMEIDHILPKSLGGKNIYSNLQLLHRHCHDSKTQKDGSLKGRGARDQG